MALIKEMKNRKKIMSEIFKILFANMSFQGDELFYKPTSDPNNFFISVLCFNRLICFTV